MDTTEMHGFIATRERSMKEARKLFARAYHAKAEQEAYYRFMAASAPSTATGTPKGRVWR